MELTLIGNQNCGKTTLFNLLTGANQHVGNWPGVTVERKTGTLLPAWKLPGVTLTDLPGIYSLSPFSLEERISRDHITQSPPDAMLNIVDATNLERSLYLTLQLLETGVPIVIALNMMDEVRRRGGILRPEVLSAGLGVPVVPICARTGEGVALMLHQATLAAQGTAQGRTLLAGRNSAALRQALHRLSDLISSRALAAHLPTHYAAARLLEGDAPLGTQLHLSAEEQFSVADTLHSLSAVCPMEPAAALADARYAWIESLLCHAFPAWNAPQKDSLSQRIDRAAAHPVLAIPLFLSIMALVFWVTFGAPGRWLSDGFGAILSSGIRLLDAWLLRARVAPFLRDMLTQGVLTGVGSVLSFLPTMLLLFFCLTLLEDSGYMARAAFLMDRPLRTLGLNGSSFIPLLMGFGCTVPAVMAARTMRDERDRRFTVLLVPFMSCGAKVPVYGLFAQAFFPRHTALVVSGLYLLGIGAAILVAFFLKRTAFTGEAAPFLMELPDYRLPTPRNVLRNLWDRAGDFLQRAFTVIFLSTLAVWFLQAFTPMLSPAESVQASMLGQAGRLLSPLLAPLGYGTPEAAAALLSGLMAKESIIATLTVVTGGQSDPGAMLSTLHALFPSAASACSFLTFVLLYAPCAAATAAMCRELGSRRRTARALLFQTTIAWLFSFFVYHAFRLLW